MAKKKTKRGNFYRKRKNEKAKGKMESNGDHLCKKGGRNTAKRCTRNKYRHIAGGGARFLGQNIDPMRTLLCARMKMRANTTRLAVAPPPLWRWRWCRSGCSATSPPSSGQLPPCWEPPPPPAEIMSPKPNIDTGTKRAGGKMFWRRTIYTTEKTPWRLYVTDIVYTSIVTKAIYFLRRYPI
jgi:hypothetical protein